MTLMFSLSFPNKLSLSSLFLCEEKPTERDPKCSKKHIEDRDQGSGHMYPNLHHLAVLEVFEVRRASSVNVVELEGRHPDVRHWDLHGEMKGWIGRILQVDPPASQRTWAPRVRMSRTWSAASCSMSNRCRWFAVPASIWIDFAEAIGQ